MFTADEKILLDDVTIEITNQCQLRCRHCGIWAETGRHEMEASLIVRMMRELFKRYRLSFVSLTGGEPFLHKHCGKLLTALSFFRERGDVDRFGIYTNGADGEAIQRLLSDRRHQLKDMVMGISLDGSQATHDQLRGPGAYQKTLQTIEWVSRDFKEISLELKFTINRMNYHELTDVYRLARYYNARFSPKIMESHVAGYYHRCSISGVQGLAALSADMLDQVRRQLDDIAQSGYFGIDRDLLRMTAGLLYHGRDCISGCKTPGRVLFINCRREVYPCLYLPSAGRVCDDGRMPESLEETRRARFAAAIQGNCPGCFAYHGFLKRFNLPYFRELPVPR